VSPLSDSELYEVVKNVMRRVDGSGESISLEQENSIPEAVQPAEIQPRAVGGRLIAIGADHGGYDLKENIKKFLQELGYSIIDCGTHDKTSVDYPDIAHAVALKVSTGEAWRGIIIDGAGIGSAVTANKVPGVRAGLCYNQAMAVNSREHNDVNVLTLGSGMIGINLAQQITKTWLLTEFGGGRHARRVEKIIAIEKHYLKNG
jgi:ribose 5-phosphate isomerase B